MQELDLCVAIVQVLGIRLDDYLRIQGTALVYPSLVILREDKSESPSVELIKHQDIRSSKVRIASTVHNPSRQWKRPDYRYGAELSGYGYTFTNFLCSWI